MSVYQTQSIFKRVNKPLDDNLRHSLLAYFVYDYQCSIDDFKMRVPSAKPVGLGFLPDYTWHLNIHEQANLRISPRIENVEFANNCPPVGPFMEHQQYTGTGRSGTFGIVYAVSAEDERRISTELVSSDRTRIIIQNLRIMGFAGSRPHQHKLVAAIMHVDFRNTCDGLVNVWDGDKARRERWVKGLMQLRVQGVPEGYIAKILTKLGGKMEDIEPISIYYLPPPPPRPFPLRAPAMEQHVNYVQTASVRKGGRFPDSLLPARRADLNSSDPHQPSQLIRSTYENRPDIRRRAPSINYTREASPPPAPDQPTEAQLLNAALRRPRGALPVPLIRIPTESHRAQIRKTKPVAAAENDSDECDNVQTRKAQPAVEEDGDSDGSWHAQTRSATRKLKETANKNKRVQKRNPERTPENKTNKRQRNA